MLEPLISAQLLVGADGPDEPAQQLEVRGKTWAGERQHPDLRGGYTVARYSGVGGKGAERHRRGWRRLCVQLEFGKHTRRRRVAQLIAEGLAAINDPAAVDGDGRKGQKKDRPSRSFMSRLLSRGS